MTRYINDAIHKRYNKDALLPAKIHVALASDDNYFEGLLVTACSMAKACSRPGDIVVHLIDGGISRANMDFLEKTLARFSCQLSTIRIDTSENFPGFRQYHGSAMTYARLLLPDLLPEVEYAIYSDVDILWTADVAKLWDSLDKNAILHFVPPHPTQFNKPDSKEIEWFAANGFNVAQSRRFCAGMIAINLDIFRRESLHRKMLKTLCRNAGHVPNNDETILNAFLSGRKDAKPIDFKWQVGTGDMHAMPRDLECALHYAADTPWKTIQTNHRMLTDSIIAWHVVHASLRKISVWQSLRSCNSPFGIIAGRLLFLAASNSAFARFLLRMLLRFRGHGEGCACLMAFVHKSGADSLLRRVRSEWRLFDTSR